MKMIGKVAKHSKSYTADSVMPKYGVVEFSPEDVATVFNHLQGLVASKEEKAVSILGQAHVEMVLEGWDLLTAAEMAEALNAKMTDLASSCAVEKAIKAGTVKLVPEGSSPAKSVKRDDVEL